MNPFIQNHKLALIKVHQVIKTVDTNDISDGIILNYQETTKSYCAEQQTKTSVYDIPYIESVLFTQMSSKSRDLLLYIIYNIQTDTDYITLKLDNISKKMNVSRPTLLKAIQELEDVAVICKKSQSDYWINPLYIFKGNRIKYYQSNCPDCIEIKAEIRR